MGTMRGLPPRQKARIKRIRAERGIKAAIAAAGADNGLPQAEYKRPRKKRTLSPARLRALKLHGRYIGAIRSLPAAKRAKVKRIRAEKGVRAAIAAAERMAG